MLKAKKESWRIRVLKIILSVIIGGVLGFLYYKLVGCRTGSCPITSNQWVSTIYGAVMGLIIGLI